MAEAEQSAQYAADARRQFEEAATAGEEYRSAAMVAQGGEEGARAAARDRLQEVGPPSA
jgi:hypothetical protein